MKVQIALTVNKSKRMIAKVFVSLPEIKNALGKERILLKGRTTVSSPMYIFGRCLK